MEIEALIKALETGAIPTLVIVLYLWIRDTQKQRDRWLKKYLDLEREVRDDQRQNIKVLEELLNAFRGNKNE